MRDGSKYSGQVKRTQKDLQHGLGFSRWSNGSKHEGEWANGQANGEGKFIFKSGVSVEGTFLNNSSTGPGIFTDRHGVQHIKNFYNS